MYDSLVDQTRKAVQKQSPGIEEFRQKITLLPSSVKEEYQKCLEEILPKINQAETIEAIFGYLNLLWNYLDFGLLQHVIQVYGDEELKKKMEEYNTAVKIFRDETPLDLFLRAQPKRQYREVPDGLKCNLKKVMFKHNNFTLNSFLSEVESYRQQLACEFSLPVFAVILEQIETGSVSTVWLVPPSVAAKMKEQMQSKHVDFLQKHNIIQMTIDGTIVYPSGECNIHIYID